MRLSKAAKSILPYAARKIIVAGNVYFTNHSDVIWLIGDGRSGTTWVSNLINYQKNFREMHEPFHPKFIKNMTFLRPHEYMRHTESHTQLEDAASVVFTGKLTNPRVDSAIPKLHYKGLLIKDIFANLFSYWASLRFPHVKIILLMRNPFAVALSKYKMKHNFWATEPMDLLKQTCLHQDYLLPFEDLIRKTSQKNDYLLNQILIWSIINYVPLCQFKPGQIHIVFYEDMVTNPSREVEEIWDFVHPDIGDHHICLDRSIITLPSRVSGSNSNVMLGTSPITSWKNKVRPQIIHAGLDILEHFGLAELYDEHSMPNKHILSNIHKNESTD